MDIQSTIKATVEQVVSKYVTKPPTTHNGSVETVVGNTANVLLDGGAEPTPCSMRVSCRPGERVSVTIEHHRAYVTGNLSAPPTDDTTAIIAQGAALDAMESAELAAEAASDAQASAVVANTAANNALYGLGTVQDVVDALGEDVDDLQTHVALTDEGLFVVVNDEGYRLKLANDGAYIIDGSGDVVTTLSESITLSSSRPQYIGGDDAYIVFYDTDDDGTPDTIRIGGNVIMGGSKTLAEVLADLEGTLVYDHTYEYSADRTQVTFTAHLFRGGEDVKSEYAADCFTWYYKTEAASEHVYIGNGYTCTVDVSDMGYGGHVIGKFTKPNESELLTSDDDTLTTSDDEALIARTASGDSVRVSDLSVATVIYPTDNLLVSGPEDEHLVTIATLQAYLESNMTKQVRFGTTAQWSTQTGLVSESGTVYVYTDHATDSLGNAVAGIKVGDGNAYLVDLPFTDALLMEHVADTTAHITAEERVFWNNKVRAYYTGAEQLVLTTS